MKVADSSTAMTQMGSRRPSPRKRRLLTDLAAIREAKGISLQQISEATKIGVRYLKAIESSQFEELPGGLFNTSYIRQYARAIDYDEMGAARLLRFDDSGATVGSSASPRIARHCLAHRRVAPAAGKRG